MSDLACGVSGVCTAPYVASGTANCIHCGKELVEISGKWFTWDAAILSSVPRPQQQEGGCVVPLPRRAAKRQRRKLRRR